MKGKDSFLLYESQCRSLLKLSDEARGQLLARIIEYRFDGIDPEFDDLAQEILFDQIRDQINRDTEKYAERCRKNQEIALERERQKREAAEHERARTYTKSTDTDNGTDTGTDNDTGNGSGNGTGNESDADGIPDGLEPTAPTLSEIRSECTEKGYKVDPLKFYETYQKQDWMFKGQPIDWKDRLREWNRTEYQKPTKPKNAWMNFSQREFDPDLERDLILNGNRAATRG